MTTWPVAMMLAAWDDLDRALEGVTREEATRGLFGGSSFAWTLAHVTQGVDSWINVRFQGHRPQQLIAQPRFRFGGSGEARDLDDIRAAVAEVRALARPFLEGLTDADLDATKPYDGSFSYFREHGINVRAALVQNTAHHAYHIGEIVSKREMLGHAPGVFPGTFARLP